MPKPLTSSRWRHLSHVISALTLVGLGATAGSVWSSGARARPSFVCNAPLSPAESAICADDSLGDLDSKLADAYAAKLTGRSSPEKTKLVSDQQRWIVKRDVECGSSFRSTDSAIINFKLDVKECLKAQYNRRIDELSAYSFDDAQPISEMGFSKLRYVFAPHLLESHDEDLCRKLLDAVNVDYFSLHHYYSPWFSPQPELRIPGGAWIALPSTEWTSSTIGGQTVTLGDPNRIATFKADLEQAGQQALVVFQSSIGSIAAVEYTDVHVYVQSKADRKHIENEVIYGAEQSLRADPSLAEVSLFSQGERAWGYYEPIRFLVYKKRYYILKYIPGVSRMISLRTLRGDGSSTPVCSIEVVPSAIFPGVRWGNEPEWPIDESSADAADNKKRIEIPMSIGRFLGVLRRIQGEQPAYRSGIGWTKSQSAYFIRSAIVQPWDSLLESDKHTGPRHEESVEWTEADIRRWQSESLSNYRLVREYEQQKSVAEVALADLYHNKYGIDVSAARQYARKILNKIITASFSFSQSRWPSVPTTPTREDFTPENLHQEVLIGAPPGEVLVTLTREGYPDSEKEENRYSEPTLFFALEHPTLVELLLDHGGDIEAINQYGKTALMYAAHFDLEPTVRLLLKRGAVVTRATNAVPEDRFNSTFNAANINIRCDHRTALTYAAENASAPVIDLLLDAGASTADRDTCDHSVADYFARNTTVTPAERERLTKRFLVSSPP